MKQLEKHPLNELRERYFDGNRESELGLRMYVLILLAKCIDPRHTNSTIYRTYPTLEFLKTYRFLTKISIFEKIFDFWQKFRSLWKFSIFDKNFDRCENFRFLTKISIFEKIFDFWQKFRSLTKVSIFDKNFDLWENVTIVEKKMVLFRYVLRNFFQRLKIFSKIEIFLDEIEIFVKYRSFCQKYNLLSMIEFFIKIILFSETSPVSSAGGASPYCIWDSRLHFGTRNGEKRNRKERYRRCQ